VAQKDNETVTRRRRATPEERKEAFLVQAAELFAERGFDAGTRELAEKLGVTQPLLYRYFPSKEDLIDEVYRFVFLDSWKGEWATLIADRSLPLRTRLIIFYKEYTAVEYDSRWMRIYLYSGLRDSYINKKYLKEVSARIIAPFLLKFGIHVRQKQKT